MPKDSYYARYLPSVSRDNTVYESDPREPEWAKQFYQNLEQLEKQSVKSKKEDHSLYDQINQIINGKSSKYSTVEEAVQDMKVRTGLDALQTKQAQTQSQSEQKTTNDVNSTQSTSTSDKEPPIFAQVPEMKIFIDNYVHEHPGVAIEAVVQALLRLDSIKKKLEKNDVGNDVRHYINKQLTETKHNNPIDDSVNFNIGKVDHTVDINQIDNDPFAICTPSAKN